jgi:Rrf2 family transcriptional regulator, nitric oxide-sensitive transcriptional repressor
MQLSLHADYSCRTLMYLALCPPNEKSSIEDIARAYGISENHLVKVVHKLGKLGFVETTRGRGGGIKLARSAEDISIGEVIRKTEPGFELVECFNVAGNTCPVISSCGLKPWLGKAMDAFIHTLDDITVADVIGKNAKQISSTLRISM